MLKIKDNIDLKELEKFEFEASNSWYHKTFKTETDTILYYIPKNSRTIQVIANFDVNLDDTLYDLIKADLVEKVEEENEI